MSRFAVVGVGNLDRGDDGAGPLVASLVRGALPDGRLSVAWGACEPTRVLEALADVRKAFVIDACVADPPGDVLVFDGPHVPSIALAETRSTHGFDLGAILALGCRLKALPPKLWVVAITGRQFELGAPMSSEVRLGAIRATGRIVGEVCRWLNDSNDC